MPKKLHLYALALVPLLVFAAMSAIEKKEDVCQGSPMRALLLSMPSGSDLETSRAIAKPVSEQLIDRVVPTCGSIGASLVPRRPQSNLEPEFKALTPEKRRAANRVPVLNALRADAQRYVEDHLLDRLPRAQNIGSSPFFGASVAVADEVATKGYSTKNLLIVFTGDGIVFEDWKGMPLSFGLADLADERVLQDISKQLEPLAGACVLMAGLGRAAAHDPEVLRRARARLTAVFNNAGVGFRATVTKQLPSGCPPVPAPR